MSFTSSRRKAPAFQPGDISAGLNLFSLRVVNVVQYSLSADFPGRIKAVSVCPQAW